MTKSKSTSTLLRITPRNRIEHDDILGYAQHGSDAAFLRADGRCECGGFDCKSPTHPSIVPYSRFDASRCSVDLRLLSEVDMLAQPLSTPMAISPMPKVTSSSVGVVATRG